MTEWMKNVYMQYPAPQDLKGVTVELYATSEDGSTTSIGTAKTDPLKGGVFSLIWTPPREGRYVITAVFAGSKSYWDSYASTSVGVTTAPPEAPAPATTEQVESIQSAVEGQQSMMNTLMVLVAIAIIIGVVNIILIVMKLRK